MLFEDEASLSNTATLAYTWGKKGEQPRTIQPQRRRERVTLFGAVAPLTGEFVQQVSSRGNTSSFFSFLLKVAGAYRGQKVYLVLDNVRFHHAKRLKRVLDRYSHRVELVFLPPYSPDLNPVERIWWAMRKQITHNRWMKSMDARVREFERWSDNLPCQTVKNLCNLIENIY